MCKFILLVKFIEKIPKGWKVKNIYFEWYVFYISFNIQRRIKLTLEESLQIHLFDMANIIVPQGNQFYPTSPYPSYFEFLRVFTKQTPA